MKKLLVTMLLSMAISAAAGFAGKTPAVEAAETVTVQMEALGAEGTALPTGTVVAPAHEDGLVCEVDFFSYINTRRAEMGLSALQWRDDLAITIAQQLPLWIMDDNKRLTADPTQYICFGFGDVSGGFTADTYEEKMDRFMGTLTLDSSPLLKEDSIAIVTYYKDGAWRTAGIVAYSWAFTYTDMNTTVYYVVSPASISSIPSGEGILQGGVLNVGTLVTVTGRCNETGWYRISDKDGSVAYVPGECLTTGETWDDAEVDRRFVDYLNQKRAEAGLNPLEWMSDYEEIAKQRSIESVSECASDTPHAGRPKECGENQIGCSFSGDIYTQYNLWYNSPSHRANMLNPKYTKAVYAIYRKEGLYYAITLFK